jgi:hypothetical protein
MELKVTILYSVQYARHTNKFSFTNTGKHYDILFAYWCFKSSTGTVKIFLRFWTFLFFHIKKKLSGSGFVLFYDVNKTNLKVWNGARHTVQVGSRKCPVPVRKNSCLQSTGTAIRILLYRLLYIFFSCIWVLCLVLEPTGHHQNHGSSGALQQQCGKNFLCCTSTSTGTVDSCKFSTWIYTAILF